MSKNTINDGTVTPLWYYVKWGCPVTNQTYASQQSCHAVKCLFKQQSKEAILPVLIVSMNITHKTLIKMKKLIQNIQRTIDQVLDRRNEID